MRKNPDFEIVQMADENLAIPIGEELHKFNGVVALSEATAYLLNHMELSVTIEDLVNILIKEYDVPKEVAEIDIINGMEKLKKIGIVIDD